LQPKVFTLPQSSIVVVITFMVLLLVSVSTQHPFSLLKLPKEAIAQQQSGQETRQNVPLGAASGGNFTNYTNPQYGFSLLYPTEWVNEELNPGANATFLMSFGPPASEFGDFVFVYMAVKNLTNNNTSLDQFANQEIGLLKLPPAATSPTEDTSARTIVESGQTTIAGNTPAYKVVYFEKVSGTLSKVMEVYTVQQNKGYIFTYLAYTDIYDVYLPIAQKMVDSLNITVPSNQ
jgi:eukaryotic-like serine/threonine-protein kinase